MSRIITNFVIAQALFRPLSINGKTTKLIYNLLDSDACYSGCDKHNSFMLRQSGG